MTTKVKSEPRVVKPEKRTDSPSYAHTDNVKLRRKMRKNTREKQRRSELNNKFDSLCNLLGRKSKAEKFAVLSDAINTINALRAENERLKRDSTPSLDLPPLPTNEVFGEEETLELFPAADQDIHGHGRQDAFAVPRTPSYIATDTTDRSPSTSQREFYNDDNDDDDDVQSNASFSSNVSVILGAGAGGEFVQDSPSSSLAGRLASATPFTSNSPSTWGESGMWRGVQGGVTGNYSSRMGPIHSTLPFNTSTNNNHMRPTPPKTGKQHSPVKQAQLAPPTMVQVVHSPSPEPRKSLSGNPANLQQLHRAREPQTQKRTSDISTMSVTSNESKDGGNPQFMRVNSGSSLGSRGSLGSVDGVMSEAMAMEMPASAAAMARQSMVGFGSDYGAMSIGQEPNALACLPQMDEFDANLLQSAIPSFPSKGPPAFTKSPPLSPYSSASEDSLPAMPSPPSHGVSLIDDSRLNSARDLAPRFQRTISPSEFLA